MNSLVSLIFIFDVDNNIYIINNNKKNYDFPIKPNNLGEKIDHIPIEGKIKNQLIDILSDTTKFGIIIRNLELEDHRYIAFSILLKNLTSNIVIKNSEVCLLNPDNCVLIFFIDNSFLVEIIKKELMSEKLSLIEILKMIGYKGLIALFIILEITSIFVIKPVTESITTDYGKVILDLVLPD